MDAASVTLKKLRERVLEGNGDVPLALLLGSTTDGVMHGADCDVLAVKVDTEPAAT